ncbi:MAG: hypothetical protein ABWK53_05300 [Anaerolineales bacterium]
MSPEWRDLTAQLGAIAFVLAVFYLFALPRRERFSRRAWPAWAAVALFLGAILYSMWSETLRPLVRAGESFRALQTALGLALILLAVMVLTWGGFRFVMAILTLMHEASFLQNAAIGREGTKRHPRPVVRAARGENLRLIGRAALPGCLWMALAFGLLALGGWLAP